MERLEQREKEQSHAGMEFRHICHGCITASSWDNLSFIVCHFKFLRAEPPRASSVVKGLLCLFDISALVQCFVELSWCLMLELVFTLCRESQASVHAFPWNRTTHLECRGRLAFGYLVLDQSFMSDKIDYEWFHSVSFCYDGLGEM